MKLNRVLFIALLLFSATTFGASDWVERIGAVVPDNVTFVEVEETADYVNIVGTAKTNADISALMRAIAKADLGDPDLQKIKRNDGISDFVLRVRAKR